MKRIALLVTVLALALTLTTTSGGASAAPVSGVSASVTAADRTAAPTAARGQALGKWKCKKYDGGSVVGKTCARLRVLKEDFKVDYQRTFYNKFKRPKSFSCSTSKSKTWEFSTSVTGSVEAGVIFSKVAASATAGVKRTYTTTDTASANFRLGGKKYGHCERGTYVYEFRGKVKKVRCNAGGCRNTVETFKGKAPSRDFFAIGPGRG